MDAYQKNLAWKKNARHLYDCVITFELPWPSLTVQVFPELSRRQSGKSVDPNCQLPATRSVQRVLLATNTGGQDTDYLRIGELTLPDLVAPESMAEYDVQTGTIGGFHPNKRADMRIVQRIQCLGSITRARYMPQNPNIVATISSTGDVAIWDLTRFPYRPVDMYMPTARLLGHRSEGLCVDWSPLTESRLASGDLMGTIFVWSLVENFNYHSGEVTPIFTLSNHLPGTAVNDLQWHPRKKSELVSVGDDGWLYVYNVNRHPDVLISVYFGPQPTENAPKFTNEEVSTHQNFPKPTSVAWNPVNERLIAIGFDNGQLQLWDLSQSTPRVLQSWANAHDGYITQVKWNTYHPSVLVTASEDCTAKIWDASLDTATGPMFVHGGHMAPITDLAWDPCERGTLITVSEDNALHAWRPATNILGF